MEPTAEALANAERATARATAADEAAARASAAFDDAIAADLIEKNAAPAQTPVNLETSEVGARMDEALTNPQSTSEANAEGEANGVEEPAPTVEDTEQQNGQTKNNEEDGVKDADDEDEKDVTPAEANESPEKNKSFGKGDELAALASFDNQYHHAKVIRVASDASNPKTARRYYVHFLGYNKRCDGWMGVNQTKQLSEMGSNADGMSNGDTAATLNAYTAEDNDGGDVTAVEAAKDTSENVPSNEVLLTRRQKRKLAELGKLGNVVLETPNDEGLLTHENTDKRIAIELKIDHEHEGHAPVVKNVETLMLGKYEMDCWYHSPFPESFWMEEEVANGDATDVDAAVDTGGNTHTDDTHIGNTPTATADIAGNTPAVTKKPPNPKPTKLYACEFCLKYMRKRKNLTKHKMCCPLRHPPGDEIYRQPSWTDLETGVKTPETSVFEVDGAKVPVYCQNLSLISKLFLDHKTLYYDVEPFLFYVLVEREEVFEEDEGDVHTNHNAPSQALNGNPGNPKATHQTGVHTNPTRTSRRKIVGYFSKEKHTREGYNLACILTLPPFQRKGYGTFLIAFSYELSKLEGRAGTPERPLSDLGQVSYRQYWTRAVLQSLHKKNGSASVGEISRDTGVAVEDVIATLDNLQMLSYYRGSHAALASVDKLREAASQRCPDVLQTWDNNSKKDASNRKGQIDSDTQHIRFEKGKVYTEFLNWRPNLDRLPVAVTRKRAGRVANGNVII
tara:strand:- start:4439 stop:6640 length:2202 start_codon:yes stop_codon:yes gene_type:complete